MAPSATLVYSNRVKNSTFREVFEAWTRAFIRRDSYICTLYSVGGAFCRGALGKCSQIMHVSDAVEAQKAASP
jgi:hypothetical protein